MSWNLPQELDALAKALRGFDECAEASRALTNSFGRFNHDWRARKAVKSEDAGIPLPPVRDQGLHPRNSRVVTATLSFDFELGAPPDADRWQCPKKAAFEVCIRGELDTGRSVTSLEDHWRVDTDAYADDPKPGREPHPLVHFQRGGLRLEQFSADPGFVPGAHLPEPTSEVGVWRGAMQCPGPRIPLPPMCPLLAIDFSISQLNGVIWRKLRGKREYQSLVAQAQARLWLPYFHSLSDASFQKRHIGRIMADR